MIDELQLASLEDLADVLHVADYACSIRSLDAFPRVLVARSSYALMACIEVEGWRALEEVVVPLQVALTHLAEDDEIPDIRWDLYVLLHIRTSDISAIDGDLMERVENDTRYCRKFVRVNIGRRPEQIDKALRPLLPVRPLPVPNQGDTLLLLRERLAQAGIDAAIADAALSSFRRSGRVSLS